MVKEKRILSYFMGWLLLGFLVCFLGITNVFAEEITPTEIRSQIRTIYTDGTTQWYKSDNNTYTTPLYFGTGPSYSTYGIPCNFRLLVVSNIESTYSYKYSYDMHIFTPYSTSNTWDSSKIDSQYDLKVLDDSGIVKESKCSVISTEKNTNAEGTFMNKSISCVFTVNKSYSNAYISAGYFCKGNCELSNMEPLGFIPQDSYMSIDNVRTEKLSDNSNVIIDQNQTIIDQNNTTNEKLDDVEDAIDDLNKDTQQAIKDQFNTCRDSYNLLNISNFTNSTNNGINWSLSTDKITIQSIGTLLANYSETNRYSTNLNPGTYKFYVFDTDVKVGIWLYNSTSTTPIATVYNNQNFTINENVTRYAFFFEGTKNKEYNFSFKPAISLSTNIMSKYEIYGEKICSNKLDDVNNTSKGIWQTLKDLPSTIINLLLDALKSLFIPEDGYFEEWFNELKVFFEEKLGFLATPFTIIIDFINRYLTLDSGADIVINIPDISVPNFEEHTIIKATSLNWTQLLKSKESFNTLWQLYLSFVDVFLILNFINLCENKYNRIFGGDTSQYEYYTVEESYTINDNTGEATNHRLNERRTTRKKVNK